ncbi:MAG TPA: TRAP transporter small permease [Burkholderiales bacterium]|nr:TRAP transporter small permease [Burkholderiales bacterium]
MAGAGGRIARFAFVTAPDWILGTLMLAGVALVFANVVGRYAFGQAIFWAEEVLVFLVVWSVFVGMGAIAYQGAHLNMDLFSAQFRGRWRLFLNGVTTAALLATCIFMIVQSYQVVLLMAQSGQRSLALGVPKVIPHAALLVGFVLTVLAVIVRIRSYLTGKF